MFIHLNNIINIQEVTGGIIVDTDCYKNRKRNFLPITKQEFNRYLYAKHRFIPIEITDGQARLIQNFEYQEYLRNSRGNL